MDQRIEAFLAEVLALESWPESGHRPARRIFGKYFPPSVR